MSEPTTTAMLCWALLSTVNSSCYPFDRAAIKCNGWSQVCGLVDVQDSELYPGHEDIFDSMLFCSSDISWASREIDLLRKDARTRSQKYHRA